MYILKIGVIDENHVHLLDQFLSISQNLSDDSSLFKTIKGFLFRCIFNYSFNWKYRHGVLQEEKNRGLQRSWVSSFHYSIIAVDSTRKSCTSLWGLLDRWSAKIALNLCCSIWRFFSSTQLCFWFTK